MVQKSRYLHYSPFLDTDYFDSVIEYLDIEATADDEVDHPGKHLIGVPVIIADTADADGSHLPDIIVIDLGHGDIELITYPTGNGLQDLPFTLERHVLRYTETNFANAYIHGIEYILRGLIRKTTLPIIYH
jgi:hypothetical protein